MRTCSQTGRMPSRPRLISNHRGSVQSRRTNSHVSRWVKIIVSEVNNGHGKISKLLFYYLQQLNVKRPKSFYIPPIFLLTVSIWRHSVVFSAKSREGPCGWDAAGRGAGLVHIRPRTRRWWWWCRGRLWTGPQHDWTKCQGESASVQHWRTILCIYEELTKIHCPCFVTLLWYNVKLWTAKYNGLWWNLKWTQIFISSRRPLPHHRRRKQHPQILPRVKQKWMT